MRASRLIKVACMPRMCLRSWQTIIGRLALADKDKENMFYRDYYILSQNIEIIYIYDQLRTLRKHK